MHPGVLKTALEPRVQITVSSVGEHRTKELRGAGGGVFHRKRGAAFCSAGESFEP